MAALAYTAKEMAGVAKSPLDIVLARNIATNPIAGIHFLYGRGLPYADLWHSLSGVVHDEYGAPAQRVVYAVDKTTKMFYGPAQSNALTGAFILRVPFSNGHYVVKEDPTENAQIFDNVTPI